jgi:hypothetical protein
MGVTEAQVELSILRVGLTWLMNKCQRQVVLQLIGLKSIVAAEMEQLARFIKNLIILLGCS